jgi:hypothetical protein
MRIGQKVRMKAPRLARDWSVPVVYLSHFERDRARRRTIGCTLLFASCRVGRAFDGVRIGLANEIAGGMSGPN